MKGQTFLFVQTLIYLFIASYELLCTPSLTTYLKVKCESVRDIVRENDVSLCQARVSNQ